MPFVLLVIGCIGGYANGCTVTTQEFSSKSNCELAITALSQDKNRVFKMFCVPR